MRVLISIGYQKFLLPDDKGAAAVMQTLSKALKVHERYENGKFVLQIEDRDDSCELLMKYMPENVEIRAPSNPAPEDLPKIGKLLRLPRGQRLLPA